MQHSATRLSKHFKLSKSQLYKLKRHQLWEAIHPQQRSYRLLDPPPWKREG